MAEYKQIIQRGKINLQTNPGGTTASGGETELHQRADLRLRFYLFSVFTELLHAITCVVKKCSPYIQAQSDTKALFAVCLDYCWQYICSICISTAPHQKWNC